MKTQIRLAVVGFICMGVAAIQAMGASFEGAVPVKLETSAGAIEVEIYPKAAPLSACDFLRYVDRKLYDGATFYRVVRGDNDHGQPKIAVIQGGLSDDKQMTPPIAHETTQQTGIRHTEGTLSLARGAVGTGSAAAFFIVLGEQPALDYGGTRNPDRQGFAAFGRVVRGMDVVRKIQNMRSDAPTDDAYMQGQLLREPVVIKRARRTTMGDMSCARSVSPSPGKQDASHRER